MTVATNINVNTWYSMKLIDINGMTQEKTIHHVTMMMAVGWVTFLLSYVVNVAFYMIHPSGVDINRSRFRNKWYFYINGRRVNLSFKRNEVLEKRNEEILLSPSVTSSSFDSST